MKRTPIRRVSAKRLAANGGKMWSTISSAPKRIRKKPRSKSEFARIYGSKERVEFVKSLPCAACGVVGYSENAHVLGNGGLSRKAGYKTIAPLCGFHVFHGVTTTGYHIGCHAMFDQMGPATFPDFDAEKAAAATQKEWEAHEGIA